MDSNVQSVLHSYIQYSCYPV